MKLGLTLIRVKEKRQAGREEDNRRAGGGWVEAGRGREGAGGGGDRGGDVERMGRGREGN